MAFISLSSSSARRRRNHRRASPSSSCSGTTGRMTAAAAALVLMTAAMMLPARRLRGHAPFQFQFAEAMSEEHRMEEYHRRGYVWPLPELVPHTPGWNSILRKRFRQIARVEDHSDKYNGWMAFMTSALVATNYTEHGWGLTRAPQHITAALKERLQTTLVDDDGNPLPTPRNDKKSGGTIEHFVNVIEGSEQSRPVMIQHAVKGDDQMTNARILEEMRPMFESWAGIDLIGSTAYGIRAYRNNSSLNMHVDRSSTHVISGIFHVDHSEDSEPWPIVIEDFQGNTNEVFLASGDVLFYESSKCFHGRPRAFQGSYYANVFMHYRPAHDFDQQGIEKEIHYAVPPHWSELDESSMDGDGVDVLEMVGTSFKEPYCKDVFCSLKESVKWRGPGVEGMIIDAGWDPETLNPPSERMGKEGLNEKRRGGGNRGDGSDEL